MKNSRFFLPWGFNILLIAVICLSEAYALGQSSRIQLDSLSRKDTVESGLLDRIISPFRFRNNRRRAEQQRIYDLMIRLTSQGNAKVDSAVMAEIISELGKFAQFEPSGPEVDYRVKLALDTLEFSASNAEIDNLRLMMTEFLSDQSRVSRQYSKIISERLQQIRKVQVTCEQQKHSEEDLPQDLPCLKPAIRIFGWHHSFRGAVVAQNYNFNYLTDIILDGYELGADGLAGNISDVEQLLDRRLIERVSMEKKGLILSVFSNSPDTISMFLRNSLAQQQFISTLQGMAQDYPLTGLNISFDGLKSSERDAFEAFVKAIHSKFNNSNSGFEISISIPPVSDERHLRQSTAFDFDGLNSLVDYYLVQTERLVTSSSREPSSPSPLYGINDETMPSIASTVAFYVNGKIPVNKLVMTLGYSGISWQSGDSSQQYDPEIAGERVAYGDIRSRILAQEYQQALRGFDMIQAAPFLEFRSNGGNKVLYYEDGRSLFMKYSWALENGLGGVALWGLGEDDGYTVAWDALAAALIRVDTLNASLPKGIEEPLESSNRRMILITGILVAFLIFVAFSVYLRRRNR